MQQQTGSATNAVGADWPQDQQGTALQAQSYAPAYGQADAQSLTQFFGQPQAPSYGQQPAPSYAPPFGQQPAPSYAPPFGQQQAPSYAPPFGQQQALPYAPPAGQQPALPYAPPASQPMAPPYAQPQPQTYAQPYTMPGAPAFGQPQPQPQPYQPPQTQAPGVPPVAPPVAPGAAGGAGAQASPQQQFARHLMGIAKLLEQALPGFQLTISLLLDLSVSPKAEGVKGVPDLLGQLQQATFAHYGALGSIRRFLLGDATPEVLASLAVGIHRLIGLHKQSKALWEQTLASVPAELRPALAPVGQAVSTAESLLAQAAAGVQQAVGPTVWAAAGERAAQAAGAGAAAAAE